MAALKHSVTRGSFSHAPCDGCSDRRPAIKLPLDDGFDSITRVAFCSEMDGKPISFNVILKGAHKVTKKSEFIVRGCSSHANYHWHRWDYLRPRKDYTKEFGRIDSVDDVAGAFQHARSEILDRAFEWRQAWLPRKY